MHCALLASILAPTDAALGQAVVSSPEVPACTRQTLNVESGLNDGIALPAVLFFAAYAGLAEGEHETSWSTFVTAQLTLGPGVGVVVGGVGTWLTHQLMRRGAIEKHFKVYVNLALALIAYGLAHEVGGNGFIAAFIAGMVAGNLENDACDGMQEFTESEGQLLMVLTFLFFGATFVAPAVGRAEVSTWLYAGLSLTAVRMIPIALSLIGHGFRLTTILFVGWFGPRGLASILFGLLVVEGAHESPIAEAIFDVVVVTVTLSAILHGMSALPLAKSYGARVKRWAETESEFAEMRPAPEMPLRTRTTRTPEDGAALEDETGRK